jgi:hypothetical protein
MPSGVQAGMATGPANMRRVEAAVRGGGAKGEAGVAVDAEAGGAVGVPEN